MRGAGFRRGGRSRGRVRRGRRGFKRFGRRGVAGRRGMRVSGLKIGYRM